MAEATSGHGTTSQAKPPKELPAAAGFGGRRPVGPVPKERAKHTSATLKRLWGYLSRQRSSLTWIIILAVASSGLALIAPYLLGRAVDRHIIPQDAEGLFQLCLVLLLIYVCSSVMSWLQTYLMAGLSQQTVLELRRDLFHHMQQLPLGYFDRTPHGELMSRTTNDIENLSNTLNQSLIQMISSAVTIIGAISFMLYLNVWLTMVSLITIPLVTVATKKIAVRTRKHFKGQQESLGQLNGYIEETISGQKVVKLFRREGRSAEEFKVMNERLRQAGTRAQILSGMMGPVMNMMSHLTYIVIAVVGGWMAFSGWTRVGVIVSFLNYSRQLSGPINELANQYNMIQSGIAGAERVFEVMDTKSEFNAELKHESIGRVAGHVQFNEVSFGYNPEQPILKRVTFSAKPGEMIALVGPTGAGKTTIMNLLTRFYDIDQGTIRIDGQNIGLADKRSLRSQLGIVLQDAHVFTDSIRNNIRYGKLDATDEEVEAAAKLANAHEFIKKLPHGYDSMLNGSGGSLSQGQRQLLTIARAILADPAILILDEATSSVDTRTELHIQAAMHTLMKGRTSFVIAHRLSTIRNADMILVINDGEVMERGSHDELIEKRGFYYELTMSEDREEAG
ncbi:ABC transporter ATP-binding protein [Paenibacillus taiwanensis]|uniref:ABC transporter ATP-binding protein n=1 Tax=Paenibacillus taiwanensis TaxID=401638 RepID=UPI0004181CB9|nr:ABC transporter ATP-binding protein [Paenibacillus taiwanensis]